MRREAHQSVGGTVRREAINRRPGGTAKGAINRRAGLSDGGVSIGGRNYPTDAFNLRTGLSGGTNS